MLTSATVEPLLILPVWFFWIGVVQRTHITIRKILLNIWTEQINWMVLILLKMHFSFNFFFLIVGGRGEVAIKICACVCKRLVLTETCYLKCAFRVLCNAGWSSVHCHWRIFLLSLIWMSGDFNLSWLCHICVRTWMHCSYSVSNVTLYKVRTLKFVCVVLSQWPGTDHLYFCIVFILKAQLGIAACSGRYFAAVLIWACSDQKIWT